jgi:hypothetical protein
MHVHDPTDVPGDGVHVFEHAGARWQQGEGGGRDGGGQTGEED